MSEFMSAVGAFLSIVFLIIGQPEYSLFVLGWAIMWKLAVIEDEVKNR